MQTTRKNLLNVSGAIAVVALLYVFVYWPNSPLGKQLQNLKIAEQQANLLRDKFRSDPIFKQITFNKYTAFNGCLSVAGKVLSKEDVYHITNLVESMRSPVKISYDLAASDGSFVFEWFDGGSEAAKWIGPDFK